MSHLSAASLPPTAALLNNTCALSVVLGSVNSARTIARALASLERACRGLDSEILVIDASTDETVSRIGDRHTGVRVRQMRPSTLMPRLWSAGYAMSRGRVVAFTTGHCVVADGWARALLAGIESGATGVAGSLTLSDESSGTDWALFYLRYSAFLGAGERQPEAVREIPGDNAAYRREALERHAASFAEGFWEVDFHRRVRAEDRSARFEFVPGAAVQFGPSASLASLVRQRFSHGSHSGAWRVETGVRARWQIVLAAPLVPVLLAARIARRVMRLPAHRTRFVAALPTLFTLAAAWAAGEAWGALSPVTANAVRTHGLTA